MITCPVCNGSGDNGEELYPPPCEVCDGRGEILGTALIHLPLHGGSDLITTEYVHNRWNLLRGFLDGWRAALGTLDDPTSARNPSYCDIRDYLMYEYEVDPIVACLLALYETREHAGVAFFLSFHASFYEASDDGRRVTEIELQFLNFPRVPFPLLDALPHLTARDLDYNDIS